MAAPSEVRPGAITNSWVLARKHLQDTGITPPRHIIDIVHSLKPNPAVRIISRGTRRGQPNHRVYVNISLPKEAERFVADVKSSLAKPTPEDVHRKLQEEATAYFRKRGIDESAIPALVDNLYASEKDRIETSGRFSYKAIRKASAAYHEAQKKTKEQQKALWFEAHDQRNQAVERKTDPEWLKHVGIYQLSKLTAYQAWLLRQILKGESYHEIATLQERNVGAVRQDVSRRILPVINPEGPHFKGGRPTLDQRTPLLNAFPQKDPQDPVPFFSSWQNGFLTTNELNNLTPTLRSYLHTKGVKISTSDYIYVWAYFGDFSGVFIGPAMKGSALAYRVDPGILDKHYGELTTLLYALRERNYPKRSAEEQQYFQAKLLRVNKSGKYGGQRIITLEMAHEQLRRIAYRQFRSAGYADQLEALIREALTRAQPYIEGKRGNFPNFTFFWQLTFALIIKSIKNEQFHKNTGNKRVRKEKPPPKNLPLEQEQVQPYLSHIDDETRRVIELRSKGRQWKSIAKAVFGENTQIAVAKARKRYSRFRQSLPESVST